MKKNTSLRKYVMLMFAIVVIAVALIGCDGAVTPVSTGEGASVAVPLGTAADFVILAKTAITNTDAGTTDIIGDLGLSPSATSDITGFSLIAAGDHATSTYVYGNVYASDMDVNGTPAKLTTAVSDMETAYNNAAGRSTTPNVVDGQQYLNLGTGAIGGLTLAPGVYTWGSTVSIGSDLTLNGSADDIWIFQIANDLNLANSFSVLLTGGAKPENIFWQVAGIATLGTDTQMEGIILSQTQIILQTGASVNGRLLAQTQVTLDAVTVVEPAP